MFKINTKDVLAICILLILSLVYFSKLFLHLHEMIYPAYDISMYHQWKNFLVENILQNKSIPLWNPYYFSGAPFEANSQAAIFYPFNLLYFFSRVELIFGYIFLLDISTIGIGVYMFARIITLERFSALIAAIIMMFSGTILSRIIPGHIIILDGIIWVPLLFYFIEKGLQQNKIIYGFIAAIPVGLMFLSGNSQIALYALFVMALYYILRILFEINHKHSLLNVSTSILIPIFSIVFGLLLAAVQLIPSYELAHLSLRSDGLSYVFAADFSLHPLQTLSFILPHFFGGPLDNTFWGKGNFWEVCGYLGVIPLLLSVIALLFYRNKYTIILLLLSIFTFLFALGKYGPLFPLFYNYIPFFDSFRAPGRMLFLYVFSISLLAGFGIEYLFKKNISRNFFKYLIFILLTAILIIFFIYVYIIERTNVQWYEYVILKNSLAVGINHVLLYENLKQDILYLLLTLCSFLIVCICKYRQFISDFIIKCLILAIILSNLWGFASNFYSTKDPEQVYPSNSTITFIIKDHSFFRVFDMTGKIEGNAINYLSGYDAISLKDYQKFLWLSGPHQNLPFESFPLFSDITNINILKLLNVKYILSNKKLHNPNVILLDSNNNYLYQIKNTNPRAFIVPNALVIKNKDTILSKLNATDFNFTQQVLLNNDPQVPLHNLADTNSVQITKYTPNKIIINITNKSAGFLLLSEIYYPGWEARDNGKKIDIYKADYVFRSVYLQKGRHILIFDFNPISYVIGMLVTLSSSFILILIFLIYKYRHAEIMIKIKKKYNNMFLHLTQTVLLYRKSIFTNYINRKIIFLVLLLIFTISLRIWNIYAIGRTYDEEAYVKPGYLFIKSAQHADFNNKIWWEMPDEPPFARYIYGLAAQFDYIGSDQHNEPVFRYDFTYSRLVSVMLASLSVLIVALLGWEFISPQIGITASIIYSMLPFSLGFSQLATLESFTMFFFTSTIYLHLRMLKKYSLYMVIITGISLAFAISSKITNLLLIPLLIFITALWIVSKRINNKRDYLFTIKLLLALIFIAVCTFIIIWPMPWFHLDYVNNYVHALRFSSNLSIPEIFFGKLHLVPVYYYFVLFFITTPLIILLLLFVSLQKLKSINILFLIILLWFIFPFTQSLYHMRQQGVRYIIEIYAPLSLLAAIGFDIIVSKITKNIIIKYVYFIPIILYLLIILIRQSPYYLDYFNEIVGGTKNVYITRSFQIGWWGQGTKEAVTYLESIAPMDARVGILKRQIQLVPPTTKLKVLSYNDSNSYDYVIMNFYNVLREGFDDRNLKKNYSLIHCVDANGACLVAVYKRNIN